MRNLKCEISQKRLIVEQNGQKFGTRGATVHLFRTLATMVEYTPGYRFSWQSAKF